MQSRSVDAVDLVPDEGPDVLDGVGFVPLGADNDQAAADGVEPWQFAWWVRIVFMSIMAEFLPGTAASAWGHGFRDQIRTEFPASLRIK